ncbi:MAG: hypothetical protein V8S27_07390 [Lachnospiraceae bacterium]
MRFKEFWEGGEPTAEQLEKIYKRKDGGPSVDAQFADGTTEKIWSTFSSEQIDIDCEKPAVKEFIQDNLRFLTEHGAALIRLDAFGYATKRPDTSCFFLEPQVWELLDEQRDFLKPYGINVLPEIHRRISLSSNLMQEVMRPMTLRFLSCSSGPSFWRCDLSEKLAEDLPEESVYDA